MSDISKITLPDKSQYDIKDATARKELDSCVKTDDSRLSDVRPANGGNSSTVNGHTVNSDVPANAKFTDTNTWRGITDSYSGTDSGTSLSQKGANSLYNALNNGYANTAGTAKSVAWGDVSGKPSTFPPASHNHDDRYYTEGEIDSKHYTTASEIKTGTVDDLYTNRKGTSGGVGSISLVKKSSGIGSEIPAGWYNYFYSPHRTGITGDCPNYATVILCPLNFSGTSYIVRYSNGAIAEVKPIITGSAFSVDGSTNTLVISSK